MYLAELRHQCCGVTTAEVYEDGEDKDKQDSFVQWVAYPKYIWFKEESKLIF